MLNRIFQITRKELLQITRDRGVINMVVLTPLIQLLIYGYVVATEIRSLPLVVLDRSESAESRRLVDRFLASGYFIVEEQVGSLGEVEDHLNYGQSMMGIVIPEDYAENVRRGVPSKVQLLVDGTNSNTATIALGYAAGIVAVENNSLLKSNFERQGFRLIEAGIVQEERVWFNPSLRSINYMIPGIICVLLMELMVPLTALSLVRERERGTIEQLMVTPLRAGEMLVGKTAPYVLLGLIDAVVILTAGTFWFDVPISGSVPALIVYSSLFIVVALGLGIFIASVVTTQQQAALSAQFSLIPNILLSGFMFPIESMPEFMQAFTTILPMRYFLVIIRGVMMKGLGPADIVDELLALAILGAIIFSISWIRFRKVFG
ncbi:MAG: ABC transporter permease [Acidobacteria bacterium]|nr:ABC transporter permease [Acidobacteriota bacterium]